MSKPMLVTWPLVMLLLDFWPLNRVSSFEFRVSSWGKLVVEKIPFFALSVASCVVTVIAQAKGGAMQSVQVVPVLSRLENTPVAYARYLGKTFWPTDLVVPYLYPPSWPWPLVLGAVVLLALVSVMAVRNFRRAPYLLFGWLWFVGTLVPVIGLLQVGGQSMADRYTYLPHIGLFIALVWFVGEWVVRWKIPRVFVGGVTAALLVACAARAQEQAQVWRSTETLFRHTLAVSPENALAMQNLGVDLVNHGRVPEAFAVFRNALEVIALDPVITSLEQAMKDLETTTNAAPRAAVALTDLAGGHRELAAALARKARYADAIRHYERALTFVPDDALSHYNLGLMFSVTGQTDAAIGKYERALALDPAHVEAHNNLAVALASQGKFAESVPHLETAVRLRPDYGEAHKNLGIALAKLGRRGDAIAELRAALRLNPTDNVAQNQLRELGAE
jgi:tetratricopeptide (TPR) repeat protein